MGFLAGLDGWVQESGQCVRMLSRHLNAEDEEAKESSVLASSIGGLGSRSSGSNITGRSSGHSVGEVRESLGHTEEAMQGVRGREREAWRRMPVGRNNRW